MLSTARTGGRRVHTAQVLVEPEVLKEHAMSRAFLPGRVLREETRPRKQAPDAALARVGTRLSVCSRAPRDAGRRGATYEVRSVRATGFVHAGWSSRGSTCARGAGGPDTRFPNVTAGLPKCYSRAVAPGSQESTHHAPTHAWGGTAQRRDGFILRKSSIVDFLR